MKLVKLDDVLELIDGSDIESNYECSKLQEEIKRLPTVDAEPVVRCKECKWGTPHPEGDEYTKCFKLCTTFFSGHYCAWGERKEDETN